MPKFFETSTYNLLAYEAAAGVRRHLALSVVRTQQLSESGYFWAKIAQDKLIKESQSPTPSFTRRSSLNSSRSLLMGKLRILLPQARN